MPFTIRYIPGVQLNVGDVVDETILNLLANPTIELEGTISTASIGDGAITEPKYQDLSVSTRALADGAVSEPKLAAASVSERTFVTGAISTRALGPGCVAVSNLSPDLAKNFGSDGSLQAFDPLSQLYAAKNFN